MKDLFDVGGRNIVVTGGAGHLGREFCERLADRGASVLSLSSKRHPSNKVRSVVCDVSDETAVELALADFRPLHGLVNCAGRAGRGIDPHQPSAEVARILIQTVLPQTVAANFALKHLAEGGSIVNIGSMWGIRSPDPAMYLDLKNEPTLAYSAAAGGILAWTRYLAVVAAPRGIRVNALVPGWFPKMRGSPRQDYMAGIADRVPMGRTGRPPDLIGPLVYLLSPASLYMTGQHLVVDGGYTLN